MKWQLLCVLLLLPIAFANLGEDVRLLQLEKSVTKSIMMGDAIIEAYEGDTVQLENIQAELKSLLEEIGSVDASTVDISSYRQQATAIVTQFREAVHNSLSEEEISRIRENVQIDEIALEPFKQRFEQLKKQHNTQRIREYMSKVGITNETILADYESDELTVSEIKRQVRELVKGLPQEKRRAAVQMARETAQNELGERVEQTNRRSSETINRQNAERFQGNEDDLEGQTQRVENRMQQRVENQPNAGINERLPPPNRTIERGPKRVADRINQIDSESSEGEIA